MPAVRVQRSGVPATTTAHPTGFGSTTSATNTPAISLYKAMGFRVRSEMNFAIIKRPDQA
jgi:hypothetical protein